VLRAASRRVTSLSKLPLIASHVKPSECGASSKNPCLSTQLANMLMIECAPPPACSELAMIQLVRTRGLLVYVGTGSVFTAGACC
jgi:hypothetical protein